LKQCPELPPKTCVLMVLTGAGQILSQISTQLTLLPAF
jgi:hypothetical protein